MILVGFCFPDLTMRLICVRIGLELLSALISLFRSILDQYRAVKEQIAELEKELIRQSTLHLFSFIVTFTT